MKKFASVLAAFAMAVTLTAAGSMITVSADADAPAETVEAGPALKMEDIAGKWKYEIAEGSGTVDQAAKDNGTVEITADGKYTYTDTTGKKENGVVDIVADGMEGSSGIMVNFYTGDAVDIEKFSFGGYYNGDAKEIQIGNGGMARLVYLDGETAETTSAAADATTTTTSTTTTTTTTAAATTTTAAGASNTGDAFPALAAAGLTLGAAAAFVMKKKEH